MEGKWEGAPLERAKKNAAMTTGSVFWIAASFEANLECLTKP